MRLSVRISIGIPAILTEVRVFPQSVQANIRIVTSLSDDGFFLNHFQINSHLSFIRSTLYKLDTESVVNSSQVDKLIG
jgi:hypothetical protein